MKKIALTLVAASTFALAACGGGTANNAAPAENGSNAAATEDMSGAYGDVDNHADAGGANEVGGNAAEANGQ